MGDKCVIVIDDDFEFMEGFLRIGLGEFGFRVEGEIDPHSALARIESEDPDVVLLDILFPEGNLGKPTLEKIKQKFPLLPVVMITSTMADEEFDPDDYPLAEYRFAKEGLAKGDCAELANTIERAISSAEAKSKAERDLGLGRFGFIVGMTEGMREVAETIEKVADRYCTVLITGESGTGKELVARAIHRLSRRKEKPFFPLVCSAVPRELLESELFGIEKGVATGVEKRIGKVEQAKGGTLFLDEIGDVPTGTQVKLLRLIQEKCFQRVGGQSEIGCDVRFVAATNRNLKELIEKKRFREDLFHRVNVVEIRIPPLRERREDIPALFEHFVKQENKSSDRKTLPILRGDVKQILLGYAWPGNIRELENSIRQATALAEENILQAKYFRQLESSLKTPESLPSGELGIVELVYEGKATWDHIKTEYAASGEMRRKILLAIIDRWRERQGRLPTSKELARLLDVSETNMRQIRLNHRIQLKDITEREEEDSPEINRFCREGEYWSVTFDGKSVFLKDRVGMRLLAHLLVNPGKEIHCLELISLDGSAPPDAKTREVARMDEKQLRAQGLRIGRQEDGGESVNFAIQEYKRKLLEIRKELEEAEGFNDTGTIERLQSEKEWLEKELIALLRPDDGSAGERARQRVSKSLNSVKELIRRKHEVLFTHLETYLKIGNFSRYNPPDPITWVTE